MPEEYTTYFRSVLVFDRARILEESEKRDAIQLLAQKYYLLDVEEHRNRAIGRGCDPSVYDRVSH